ncbi:hypothetical protein EDB81DRAFT_692746 [Dactylonectria macrodidyma]|uniref:Thiol-specific monooxygenase n=1 Tax=Dactylonectria macrodidyma TaxID=307937 RepID=A0A9P9ENX5_9HYPO|nr:hypothetical protein EDB81DRAFT_692746 [Dactylonectria macrodidyma]
MSDETRIKSVAIIGAGAAGAAAAAALKAEDYFERIRVYERRETPGGTWIYDPEPHVPPISPGGLPTDLDKPLEIPASLPAITTPNEQERFSHTPIYDNLTTNVPGVAMSFSDSPFPYGPFVPHHIPRQYIENYFSIQQTDNLLVLNTTVEDVSQLPSSSSGGLKRWKLTLRKYDPSRRADVWWEEEFDALILANGHYSVPWIPNVSGLAAYMEKFPGRVIHSKYYRSPNVFANKKTLIIGNSASGHDITNGLVSSAQLPVYQSRRSRSRWDGNEPPSGIQWKAIISEYKLDGTIVFEDGTVLNDVDQVIYCTGYKPSYPFWNSKVNGRPLWDYESNKLIKNYWHTFLQDFPTLAIVGMPRVLTFRSFEYQAVALARLFSGRNAVPLPPLEEQDKWEKHREEVSKREHLKFHDIRWEAGETMGWLDGFFQIAGLGRLTGEGRIPPAMTKNLIWAIEHIKKYPEPGDTEDQKRVEGKNTESMEADAWVVVEHPRKDLLHFI